jgi:hypothetical protein
MLILALILLISLAQCVDNAHGWSLVREERMPSLKLRIVNEGIAHDDNYWYFSNQHLLYRVSKFS